MRTIAVTGQEHIRPRYARHGEECWACGMQFEVGSHGQTRDTLFVVKPGGFKGKAAMLLCKDCYAADGLVTIP